MDLGQEARGERAVDRARGVDRADDAARPGHAQRRQHDPAPEMAARRRQQAVVVAADAADAARQQRLPRRARARRALDRLHDLAWHASMAMPREALAQVAQQFVAQPRPLDRARRRLRARGRAARVARVEMDVEAAAPAARLLAALLARRRCGRPGIAPARAADPRHFPCVGPAPPAKRARGWRGRLAARRGEPVVDRLGGHVGECIIREMRLRQAHVHRPENQQVRRVVDRLVPEPRLARPAALAMAEHGMQHLVGEHAGDLVLVDAVEEGAAPVDAEAVGGRGLAPAAGLHLDQRQARGGVGEEGVPQHELQPRAPHALRRLAHCSSPRCRAAKAVKPRSLAKSGLRRSTCRARSTPSSGASRPSSLPAAASVGSSPQRAPTWAISA